MRIAKLKIQNYRSIREIEMEPEFLCALIGENGSGKSNILKAINLVLGPTWPSSRSLTIDAFYRRDPNNKIYIWMEIEANDGNHEIVFRWEERRGNEDYYLTIDESWANTESREKFPFIFVDVNRSIQEHMASNRWTILGRLLLDINREFQDDSNRVERFKRKIKEVQDILKEVSEFSQLADLVRSEAASQLRRTPQDFSVEMEPFDPWNFYRTIQILVEDDGLKFQASEMGMGLQTSLTIALFRAYSQLRHGDAIIGIEEPEIFLHPQAQRHFYGILQELAQARNQVFYSTHSSLFVDVARFHEIVIVRREGIAGHKSTQVIQAHPADFVTDLQIRHPRTHPSIESILTVYGNLYSLARNEGFFANKIILVEGESEEVVFPIFLKAKGFDVDQEGVSVIGAGGKQNMDRLLRLYNEFKIPVYVVIDGDKDKDERGDSARATKELANMLGINLDSDYPPTELYDRFAIFEVDFETFLSENLADYSQLKTEAKQKFGLRTDSGKAIRARYIADGVVKKGEEEGEPGKYVPNFFSELASKVRNLQWERSMLSQDQNEIFNNLDEIPF